MDLGSIIIKNEQSLINARRKILDLCSDFKLNSFSTTRISTLASDFLRTVLKTDNNCRLNISYERQIGRHGLKFHFISSEIYFDTEEMKPFFNSIQTIKNSDDQDFEIFILLPYIKQDFDKDFIQQEKEKFISKSRDELLEETMTAYENIKKKNTFLSIAAHDLRNPLSVIIQAISFFDDENMLKISEKELSEMANLIKTNAQTMKSLIDNLLDISIIESGKMQYKFEQVDFIALVEKNVQFNLLLAKEKDIGLIFVKPNIKLPNILLDREKIIEVLNNLISNAIKYSHPKTSIKISILEENENVIVKIQDQGKGISEEKLKKIFIPFGIKGEKGTKGEKSTGLGLVISKNIIETHGGKINVESLEGKGSTFSFTLPLHKKPKE